MMYKGSQGHKSYNNMVAGKARKIHKINTNVVTSRHIFTCSYSVGSVLTSVSFVLEGLGVRAHTKMQCILRSEIIHSSKAARSGVSTK